MTPEVTRLLLTNQINGFCLGYKGVTRGTVEKCLAALNANCLPVVPSKGTVGSHDFAQLRKVYEFFDFVYQGLPDARVRTL